MTLAIWGTQHLGFPLENSPFTHFKYSLCPPQTQWRAHNCPCLPEDWFLFAYLTHIEPTEVRGNIVFFFFSSMQERESSFTLFRFYFELRSLKLQMHLREKPTWGCFAEADTREGPWWSAGVDTLWRHMMFRKNISRTPQKVEGCSLKSSIIFI